jgi:hypothetical protein
MISRANHNGHGSFGPCDIGNVIALVKKLVSHKPQWFVFIIGTGHYLATRVLHYQGKGMEPGCRKNGKKCNTLSGMVICMATLKI